jgi:hypothetical protein
MALYHRAMPPPAVQSINPAGYPAKTISGASLLKINEQNFD